MADVVEVFFSYAHEDEELMDCVRRQMIIWERKGVFIKWYDRKIPPGETWRTQVDHRIHAATIILLFFSPHFIESRYCSEVEGAIALKRAKNGTAIVIPVILRPCPWQQTPFAELQALPRDGRPVSQWPDRDQVCLDIAQAVADRAALLRPSGGRGAT
jgi:hypothetical protein